MFGCPDVKTVFVSAVINSNATIALNTINNTRVEFFGKHILKKKLTDNFRWRFEKKF